MAIIASNPFQSIMRRLPAPLQNRYYLTLTIFFFVMVFLDRHNLWTQWRLQQSISRLEQDKNFYQEKIKEAKDEAEDFELTKERFAREHYFMKQRNEDVFIIVDKQ
jgi:cell division protein DivIC